jgi:MFS transporter, FSR family, fosmidomycin resistance protein
MSADDAATLSQAAPAKPGLAPVAVNVLALPILLALSLGHCLNDLMQSLISAIFPLIRESYHLSYAQVGMIGATFSITASILQPIIGYATDKRPQPFSLAVAMGLTLCGLLLLGAATSYPMIIAAAALVGTGSSVFHPESTRIARYASGGRYGLAQSMFQTGGNVGSSLGPLLAMLIVVPHGQGSVGWFAAVALFGMGLLGWVGTWYRRWLATHVRTASNVAAMAAGMTPARVYGSLAILVALMFSKFIYLSSLQNYYQLYLIDHFHVPVRTAQLSLFLFLAATAAGTMLGGPIGDRIGARRVILGSILGVLPFTLMLPYASFFWTLVLTVPIGMILASAFSVIVVYAQNLLPGRVGLIGGLFFGLAFGMSGLAAGGLGWLADMTSLDTVFKICALLPAIGLLALWLPRLEVRR